MFKLNPIRLAVLKASLGVPLCHHWGFSRLFVDILVNLLFLFWKIVRDPGMPPRDSQPCSPVSSPQRWKIWSWGEEKVMGMRQALSARDVLTCDCLKTSGDLFLHLKSFSAFASYPPYPGLGKCLILQPDICMGFPGGSAGKESACNVGDLGSTPELGRPPGEGNGYPLQYSGLENSMVCTVMGSQSVGHDWGDFHFHASESPRVPKLSELSHVTMKNFAGFFLFSHILHLSQALFSVLGFLGLVNIREKNSWWL